jgi:acetyl-CoA carboxylase biotin carboxyl carrier protein
MVLSFEGGRAPDGAWVLTARFSCNPSDLWPRSQIAARGKVHDALMPTSVNAHITGTVWKIEVKQGQQVAEGQACVIIESMKMEMPVEAPKAGTVEKIHVTEGQAVSEGDVLVTIA